MKFQAGYDLLRQNGRIKEAPVVKAPRQSAPCQSGKGEAASCRTAGDKAGGGAEEPLRAGRSVKMRSAGRQAARRLRRAACGAPIPLPGALNYQLLLWKPLQK